MESLGADMESQPLLVTMPGPHGDAKCTTASQVEAIPDMEHIPRFARKDHLKQYIPELDPENPRAQTLRVKMSKRSTMLSLQLSIAAIVVIINIVLLISLVMVYPPDSRGVGTFSYGSCAQAGTTNAMIHVALNIVSSLFLGSGNYCMQILVAPTRREIDKAAQKGRYLEIGVPSFKNLFYIKRTRTLIWLAIGHCSWNSAIFNSIPIEAIPRAFATSDFLTTGDDWIVTDPLSHSKQWMSTMKKVIDGAHVEHANRTQIYELQKEAAVMTLFDTKACIDRYIDPMKATGSLIIVARNMSSAQNNGSSLIDGWVSI
ncbi:hypothetical protein E8E14_008459 [Neopestalotiopsis sp. 37M]|nr:hypothetical protein E8E14_008459 [Neopestalotiopsis sp. 37M]